MKDVLSINFIIEASFLRNGGFLDSLFDLKEFDSKKFILLHETVYCNDTMFWKIEIREKLNHTKLIYMIYCICNQSHCHLHGFSFQSEIKSETKLLRTLIKLSMEGQQPTEIELRFFTRCCLSLGQLWGGERSSEWGAALWDYFSKHLDSSFLLPGAGLDGLACVRCVFMLPCVWNKLAIAWVFFMRFDLSYMIGCLEVLQLFKHLLTDSSNMVSQREIVLTY